MSTLKRVRRGETQETEQTRARIASLVKLGWSDVHIAKELHFAIQTVRQYISELYDLAGLGGRSPGEWQFKQGDRVGRRGALRRWLNGDEE